MRSRSYRRGYGSFSCWMALLETAFDFFFGGLTGEVDVADGGLVMVGDGWMVAVFCVRSCVMECLEESVLLVVASPSP